MIKDNEMFVFITNTSLVHHKSTIESTDSTVNFLKKMDKRCVVERRNNYEVCRYNVTLLLSVLLDKFQRQRHLNKNINPENSIIEFRLV